MATGLKHVLEHLQQASGGHSDRQLLARFRGTRDEAAFAALVRRHGAMVLGVCRRLLHDFHEAQDAFQATFLVLAAKAPSLVVNESLGCYLYGVAYRTALQARVRSARRRARERPMKDLPHPEVTPAEARDWLPLLDQELSLLPEKYRAAIVVCDLEGRTRKEAARLLGIAEGTLSSRLARGHALLARRLASRGVTLSGGGLAVVMAQGAASAAVPAGLVNSTARAAVLVAAGQVAGATPTVLLMKEVMKAMLLKKLCQVVGAVMVLVALGAGGFGYLAGGGSRPAQAAPPDRPLSELEALRKENELLKRNLQAGLGDLLPAGALARLGTTRLRHAADVTFVGFGPGGKTLLTAGDDGAVAQLVQSLLQSERISNEELDRMQALLAEARRKNRRRGERGPS
jgi:RNA polymerase sigma factor (sigma-70 family)